MVFRTKAVVISIKHCELKMTKVAEGSYLASQDVLDGVRIGVRLSINIRNDWNARLTDVRLCKRCSALNRHIGHVNLSNQKLYDFLLQAKAAMDSTNTESSCF